MGWRDESHFRFHYTSDGRNEMSWQPTSVYTPDEPKNITRTNLPYEEDTWGIFLFFASLIMATLAYQYASHFSYVEHIPGVPRTAVTGVTVIATFLGTMVLLEIKIVQILIKAAIFVFCVACFFH